MKTEMQIDLSPLTGRIYIGRSRPGSNHWTGEKRDVTEPAIHAVSEHILQAYPGGVMTLTATDANGKKIAYEIEVVKKEIEPK